MIGDSDDLSTPKVASYLCIFTLPKELPVRDFNSVHINGVVELCTAITRKSFKLQSLEVSSSLVLCRLTQTRSNTTAAVDGSLGACLRVATPFFTTGYSPCRKHVFIESIDLDPHRLPVLYFSNITHHVQCFTHGLSHMGHHGFRVFLGRKRS